MNVLLVSNLYPPDVCGGYELLAADVVGRLRARGHAVHVLTTGAARENEPAWVHRRLAMVRSLDEPGRLDRLRHLTQGRAQAEAVDALLDDPQVGPIDVAVSMSLRRLGMHVPRRLQERGVPVVYSMNDRWLLAFKPGDGGSVVKRGLFSALERGPLAARTWAGIDFSRTVYVSAHTRKALQDGGAPVPEGVVALQGVDRHVFAKRFAFVPPSATAPRLLFVGRLYPSKGCDVALAALALLRASGIEATLTVAGAGLPADEAALHAFAREFGVAPFVRFLGHVPRAELGAVYRAHDVHLFPCMWDEPAGLTYLEAMSCGVPVVAMARGGAEEYLAHGDNALLVSARDGEGAARAMADQVRALIAKPALAERLVAGGERTLERASLDGYVDAIESMAIDATKSAKARASRPMARALLKAST
jgi:glycosyltransferase involved in cell wall biosynthesis